MQKLTKEQSEWLIQKLRLQIQTRNNKDFPLNDGELTLAPYMVEQIINQCTERVFPSMRHPITNVRNEIVQYIDLEHAFCSSPWIINLRVGSNFVGMKTEEFKQFTKGCISICQWLDEQE